MPLPSGPTQQASGGISASASAFTVTLGSNPAAGASLVLEVSNTGPSSGGSAVSGCGATWTKVLETTTTNGGNVQVWLGTGCSGSTKVITFTPGFSADWAAIASEWFALSNAEATAADFAIVAAGPTPGLAISPTFRFTLLIDALAISTATTPATGLSAGWTALTGFTQGSTRIHGGYRTITAPSGSYSSQWTLNAAESYQHAIVAFRGAPNPAVYGSATLVGTSRVKGTATGVIPVVPLPLEVRVYDRTAPTGLPIATWRGQGGLATHDPYNDTGSAKFDLSLTDPLATAANLAQWNLVRVFLGPFDVFQFWVETPRWNVASPDGAAGEYVTVAGRALEAYLERAMIWIGGSAFHGGFTVGFIIRSLIATAQARGAISLIRTDFDENVDSAGVAWAGNFAIIDLEFATGTDYLAVINQFRAMGLIIRLRSDFTLQIYQTYGADRKAAGVVLRQARHLRNPVSWTQPQAHAANAMLSSGAPAYFGLIVDISGFLPDRFEGYIRGPDTTDDSYTLSQLANAEIQRRYAATTAIEIEDVDHGLRPGQFEPYRHFANGDTIGLDVPGRIDNLAEPVAAIDIVSRDDADYHVNLALSSVTPSQQLAIAKALKELQQPTV